MKPNQAISHLALGLIIIVLSAGVFSVLIYHANNASSSQSTTTAPGFNLQIQEINQSNTMKSGTTSVLRFNVSSPANETIYFGVMSAPVPGTPQDLGIQNMTSRDFQLPHGVEVEYPNGNVLNGAPFGIAVIQLRVSANITINQIPLEFEVLQQASPNTVNGRGTIFNATISPG